MNTINIFLTIKDQLIDFINSAKDIFLDFFNSIYNFLLKYLSPEVIKIFLGTIAVIIIIAIFRHFNEK